MKKQSSDPDVEKDAYCIQAAYNVLQALDLFATNNAQIGVSELRKALDINANMAFRILHTLEKAKYIVPNAGTGKYYLSMKLLALGKVVTESLAISRISSPYLKLLANELKQVNVVLIIYECGDLIIAERIDSRHLPVVYAPPGRRLPLHATAGGKILMCEMSEEELERLHQRGFEKYTTHTITDLQLFKKEFEQIRGSGIAWEREEHSINLNGIAAAIRSGSGQILATICINGFVNNVSLDELDGMQEPLLETTANIAKAISYVPENGIFASTLPVGLGSMS